MHPLRHLVALLRLRLCMCSRPKATSPWVGVAPAAALATCCLSGGCAAASTDSPNTLHCTLSSTCNCLSRHSGDLAGGTGKEGQAGSWHLKHGTARQRQAGVGRDMPAVAAAALRCSDAVSAVCFVSYAAPGSDPGGEPSGPAEGWAAKQSVACAPCRRWSRRSMDALGRR